MNTVDKVKEVIAGHWIQGVAQSPDGREYCLLGAIGKVGQYIWSGDQGDVCKAIAEVVAEQYPERVGRTPWGPVKGVAGVMQFNDHPDTTEDDVIAVLEKASNRYDEIHG
jgi:hypothetical protein